MDKEYILKVAFAAGLLFVLFLWSGGVYEYNHSKVNVRYNKITGEFQFFNSKKGWQEASKE